MSEPFIDNVPSIYFGCDPEFFFENEKNEIIGAEKVIKDKIDINYKGSSAEPGNPDYGSLVLDGVQVELNPKPSTCRESLSSNIGMSLSKLKEHLKSTPNIKVSFNSVVEIKPEELDSLGDKAKVFGCAPSISNYGKENQIKVDAATYHKRAAGGHIHLGLNETCLMKSRPDIVRVLDILVGNTCVMIDRDPQAATRRLHYGRAGEYRLPKHGLEYRTLSNFWLRSYQLTSMVFGLSRMAVSVVYQNVKTVKRPPIPYGYNQKWLDDNYPEKNFGNFDTLTPLLESVDMKSIEKAINENDLDLAKKNYYGGIRQYIEKFTRETSYLSLHNKNLDLFDYFLEKVWEHGLDYWFKDDILDHWVQRASTSMKGWERFLSETVKADMNKLGDSAIISESLNLAHTVGIPTPVSLDANGYYRDDNGRFASPNYSSSSISSSSSPF